MSLRELELRGEAHYRTLEREVFERVRECPGGCHCGWRFDCDPARDLAETAGGARTVWLQASPASHLGRVRAQGDLRPMEGRPNAPAELRPSWTSAPFSMLRPISTSIPIPSALMAW